MNGQYDMTNGWYVLRDSERHGPYPWDQLYRFAQEGNVVPVDMIWHESMREWTPAAAVPGLIASPAAPPPAAVVTPAQDPPPAAVEAARPFVPPPLYGQPADAQWAQDAPQAPHGGAYDRSLGGYPAPPSAYTPPAASGRPPRRRRPAWVIPVIIALAVVLLGGGGFLTWYLLRDGDGGGGSAASGGAIPGKAEFKLPDEGSLVETAEWGEVPGNQIGIMLAEGKGRKDAERVASTLGATVVGEFEYIRVYQLELSGSGEQVLLAAIQTARATDGVELAFPNQQCAPSLKAGDSLGQGEIWGKRVSPMEDPAYAGAPGEGYRMIGVQKAWNYIRGSGMELGAVQVGVVDDGCYTGNEEFDNGVKVTFTGNSAQLTKPAEITYSDGSKGENPAGSHGTGVNSLIGADEEDGGIAGVASILNEHLTISNTNLWAPPYGAPGTSGMTAVPADPNDPTVQEYGGQTYAMGDLAAIKAEIDNGSTIINLSWGTTDWQKTDPQVTEMYKRFFQQMEKDKPGVLFVAAAGNDGASIDGEKYYPAGFALSNIVTVGNVQNDGTMDSSSNTASQNFEVTLSAPGEQSPHGYDPNTGAITNTNGGTSMAAPQVAATAALLRSLNSDLTAAQIKDILRVSARKNPAGQPILAVDTAVLMVINLNRDLEGKPRLTPEDLENLAVIDAVAIPVKDAPGEYIVKGILQGVPEGGAEVELEIIGEGEILEGDSPRRVDTAGEVGWMVRTSGDEDVIVVRRWDTKAASKIVLKVIDLNGTWAGTLTFLTFTPTADASGGDGELPEGCDPSELIGKPLPLTMEVHADPGGGGSVTINGGEDEATGTLKWAGNSVEITVAEDTSAMVLTGQVFMRDAQTAAIKGSVTLSIEGLMMTGSWEVAKAIE